MNWDSGLATLEEVVDSLPSNQGPDQSMIKGQLLQHEESLFRIWLGMDFYEALILDKVDRGLVSDFAESLNYVVGDEVHWERKVYVCVKDSVGNLPIDGEYWEEAKKFESESNEFLWRRYLKTVIAWTVFHSNVVYEAIRVTNLGVKVHGDNETFKNRSVSLRELKTFKAEISDDQNTFIMNMDRYLRENSNVFPKYLPNLDEDGVVKIKSRRANRGFLMG